MGTLTISMAMFNSYVKLPEGNPYFIPNFVQWGYVYVRGYDVQHSEVWTRPGDLWEFFSPMFQLDFWHGFLTWYKLYLIQPWYNPYNYGYLHIYIHIMLYIVVMAPIIMVYIMVYTNMVMYPSATSIAPPSIGGVYDGTWQIRLSPFISCP